MRKPVRGVLLWFTNSLSYSQKYVVAGLVRGIGYLILFFSLLWLVQSNLSLINSQISSGKLHAPYQKMFQLIENQTDLIAEENVSERELSSIRNAFNQQLKKFRALIAEEYPDDDAAVHLLLEVDSLFSGAQEALFEGARDLMLEKSGRVDELLLQLMERYGTSPSSHSESLNASYLMLERAQSRLREDQSLIRLAEALSKGKEGGYDLPMVAAALKRNIHTTQDELFKVRANLEKISAFENGQKKIRLTLNQYVVALQELIQGILSENQEVIAEGANAMSYNYNLWGEIGKELNAILEHRKSGLWSSMILIFTLAAMLTILGSWLGVHFVYEAIKSFRDLDRATKALTTGDLTARVQIVYNEEIGQASMEFNKMAEYLERLLGQQGKLFAATSQVANGDFSARVEIDPAADDEINLVTISFNKMVGTFDEIVRQLKRLGVNLSASATEIAEASKQQEELIVEQGDATREISITASEISTTAKDFASTISEVSGVAEQTSALASDGQDSLIKMEQIMRQMVAASTSISEKLTILNQKAGNITKVVTTIKNVARQTNLLSLNAAIEAEMTGRFSRDFGVIAREIRRLADQTALATRDIEQIVDEIMSAVTVSVASVEDFTLEIHEGVEKVAEVGEQLGVIIVQVQALAYRFESVNEGMQQQSEAAGSINEGMIRLSHSTSTTTDSINLFQSTIEDLSNSAGELRSMIEEIST